MIKQEIIEDSFWTDGLVKTYSDSGKYIINQDGVKYNEAIDPKKFIDDGSRIYTESDEEIPQEEMGIDV